MTEEELACSAQLGVALSALKSDKGHYVELLSQSDPEMAEHECSCGKTVGGGPPTQARLRLRVYDPEVWVHQFLRVLCKEELRGESLPENERWNLHVCRQIMYDEASDKMKFFWNFVVSSPELRTAVRDLCRLIDMFVSRMSDMPAPPPLVPRAPSRAGVRKKGKGPVPLSDEEDMFTGRGADGAVMENGQVVSIPLLGGANRNKPEGSFFEKGKSQKGAHNIGGG